MDDILLFAIIFSGVWALIGVVFLIIGIVMHNNRKRKNVNCTSSTYGKVIDLVRHKSTSMDYYDPCLYPVIEYNVGEQKFIKEYNYGSTNPRHLIGRRIEVHYNPENYNEYYIAEDTIPTKLAKIFTFVGIAAIAVAVASAILILGLFN
ncbi:MAG: DUF3592 domain-containing protein [Clostridia bacterium]|nr:DUF3592 domain-containing protein [Clostridia bacterium]